MRKCLLTALIAAVVAPAAFAAARCEMHPRDKWIRETDFRQKLEKDGYQIRKFRVDGNCYEIYGKNKEGKKVEIYFDTASGKAVKSEIED